MLKLREFISHARIFFGIPYSVPSDNDAFDIGLTAAQSLPVWNDRDALDALWAEAKQRTPERRLGTAGEALTTLKEYEKVFRGKVEHFRLLSTGEKFVPDTDNFRELLKRVVPNAVVGDIADVSYLFRKQLCVGYVIETDETSGLTREEIEGRDRSLVVLRRSGKIIAAYPCSIIRMESRGGINIM